MIMRDSEGERDTKFEGSGLDALTRGRRNGSHHTSHVTRHTSHVILAIASAAGASNRRKPVRDHKKSAKAKPKIINHKPQPQVPNHKPDVRPAKTFEV